MKLAAFVASGWAEHHHELLSRCRVEPYSRIQVALCHTSLHNDRQTLHRSWKVMPYDGLILCPVAGLSPSRQYLQRRSHSSVEVLSPLHCHTKVKKGMHKATVIVKACLL